MTDLAWLNPHPEHTSEEYRICKNAELRYFQFFSNSGPVSFQGDRIVYSAVGWDKPRLVGQVIAAKVVYDTGVITVRLCEKNPEESFSIILPDGQQLGDRNGIFYYQDQFYIASPPTLSHPNTWFLRRRLNQGTQNMLAHSDLGSILMSYET